MRCTWALPWTWVLVWLLAVPAQGEIYRWTDEAGAVHFTSDLAKIPPDHRAVARDSAREERPSRLQTFSSPQGNALPARRARRALQIPFLKRGNAMLVEVQLNDRVSAPFLVDTGASDVAIPAAVAAKAGVRIGPDTPRASYQTANGLISKPVVLLDSVVAGDARVERVRASVSDVMEVGLLGGSFFNNFTFQIDPAASLITLIPNERVRSGLSDSQWQARFRELQDKLVSLERYMQDNVFARESRVEDLERHKDALENQLEALEQEADAADVPQAWRE